MNEPPAPSRRRDTLLAVVGAAVLAAGILLVQAGGRDDGAEPDGPVFAIEYDAALDVTAAPRSVTVDEYTVTLDVTPRPTPPLTPATFRVRVTRDGAPVPVAAPELTFNMSMDMGRHVYALAPQGDAWVAEAVVLPQCRSGGRRWFARVRFDHDGETHRTVFLLDLAAPPDRGSGAPQAGPAGAPAHP